MPTSSSTAHSFLENVKRAVEKILLADRMSAHKAAYLEAIKVAWIIQRKQHFDFIKECFHHSSDQFE